MLFIDAGANHNHCVIKNKAQWHNHIIATNNNILADHPKQVAVHGKALDRHWHGPLQL